LSPSFFESFDRCPIGTASLDGGGLADVGITGNVERFDYYSGVLIEGLDICGYLTQSGWMRAAQLYESPFTDFSPRGVEGVFDSTQVTQLLSVLDNIRQAAAAS
jgi:hypothetical protein